MFNTKQLEDFLFLDIETASITPNFDSLPERLKPLWEKKTTQLNKNQEAPSAEEFFLMRAGIYAEFAKVVSISCGVMVFKEGKSGIRLKSFYGESETEILKGFASMLNKHKQNLAQKQRDLILCAHNGKEFDFPFLGRRYLINGMHVPDLLQVQGKKPWEVNFVDTMELWKFGDYKAYTSLDLLTAVLDIPSPKDDMDGSMVGKTFWQDKDYVKIKTYCEKDVLSTAQVVLRMSQIPLIEAENIEIA